MSFLPAEIIKRKRNGFVLSEREIADFVLGYTDGSVPDYQMSALLMAIYFQGMSESETLSLTKTMLHSGVVVDLSSVPNFKVDKHSTGGVGDKTSLILGPIVASLGLPVPMISGRGLGHTGGTLDKLESIPGFNTQLSIDQFIQSLRKDQICFIGQTKEICPADKKIYALRDVTATIESLPLICASIMSKKLAEGIDGLVLDVKFGSGAFMKDPVKSEELAERLMAIARGHGKKVATLITNMDQPLGRYAGNSLEVAECVSIMKNEVHVGPCGYDLYADTRELSLQLSAQMLWLGGAAASVEKAYVLALGALESGRAFEKFEQLCRIHSGRLSELPKSPFRFDIESSESGFIQSMNTESIGVAGIQIRAGRSKTTDVIEPTAGIEFHAKVGDRIEKGQPLFSVYGADQALIRSTEKFLRATTLIGDQKVNPQPLILKTLS
ncbi:MAG: thymidine phosphorylase [Bdellovibrio sp. CG10_big_fil_rev_8_21_14_0_10_47_8]|nr:MAG: thymidine phosphorylase [Bdellovibrio sp. CG10_big_fil_rev_8_21_14_0_10_47_8]